MPIRKLSPSLASQIAAGEVIQRPASVIKELLENSLDAKATRIELTIEQGGSRRIKITDNGSGIAQAELELAVAPHATSKITELADLDNILSLGFRGEALASIAAVSRLTLISQPATQTHAWRLEVNPQQAANHLVAAAHQQGTTILVDDLFFNTPARKKFLRAERTEFQHIEAVVRSIALSAMHCEIHLIHNDKSIFHIFPAQCNNSVRKRISKICGKSFVDHAKTIEDKRGEFKLSGLIATADYMRSSTDIQYFYINGRAVRDKLLMHAIREAYADSLYPGRQAAYVLYFQLPTSAVDVNVHPTKHEVRFSETRMVHDFIVSSLRSTLKPQVASTPRYSVSEPPATYQRSLSTTTPIAPQQGLLLYQRYYLHQRDAEWWLLDGYAAAQQIYFAKLNTEWAAGEIIARPVLVPVRIKLDTASMRAFKDNKHLLAKLGLNGELWGEDEIIVRKFPILLENAAIKNTVNAVLTKLQKTKLVEHLLETMAQSNIPDVLSIEQAQTLLSTINAMDSQLTAGLKRIQATDLVKLLA